MRQRLPILGLALALVILVGLGVHYVPSWQWLVDHEQAMRDYVQARPVSSWLWGVLLYFAISLVPGTGGKSVVCGWLFGFVPALIMVNVGMTLAAVVAFLYVRWIWRNCSRRWLPIWLLTWVDRGQAWLDSEQLQLRAGTYLLTLRLLPAPYTLVNYAAATTRVRVSTFAWTTQVGTLPGIVVFTFAGAQVPSLKEIAEQGALALLDGYLILALLGMSCLPLLMHQVILRLWPRESLPPVHKPPERIGR
jgi:uncharacterized membrane protein YdjX (TVP38/TMEM64 family)